MFFHYLSPNFKLSIVTCLSIILSVGLPIPHLPVYMSRLSVCLSLSLSLTFDLLFGCSIGVPNDGDDAAELSVCGGTFAALTSFAMSAAAERATRRYFHFFGHFGEENGGSVGGSRRITARCRHQHPDVCWICILLWKNLLVILLSKKLSWFF